MIVYNHTVKIDPGIEKPWIRWQKEQVIPVVMATGLFSHYSFYRLLEQDETEGCSFTFQFFTTSVDHYKKFADEFAPVLLREALAKWGSRFVSFSTVMEAVN